MRAVKLPNLLYKKKHSDGIWCVIYITLSWRGKKPYSQEYNLTLSTVNRNTVERLISSSLASYKKTHHSDALLHQYFDEVMPKNPYSIRKLIVTISLVLLCVLPLFFAGAFFFISPSLVCSLCDPASPPLRFRVPQCGAQ